MLLLTFVSLKLNAQDFIEITKDNSGQTIYLDNTQVLEIKLPLTPSNGYTWCISSDYKSIQQTISEIGERDFVSSKTSANGRVLVGQSGIQIIRYIGTSQGTTTFTLELKRPWEKNQPPIDNFTITVISNGKYSGTYSPQPKKEIKHLTSTSKSVPSKWDWRSQCTPITNQMSCGDCWAFAGVATLECNIKIHDGVTRDISEAYVTNCDNDSDFLGCGGGWCPHNYWMAPRGAVYESDCPWTTSLGNGTTGTCAAPYPYHETIDTFALVPGENPADSIPPDSNLKSAIYNYGPIWVALDASNPAFSGYTGGIYTVTTSTYTDHAIALVGWVDSAAVSGGGYWILRNSWGSSWGMSGYMYISYGTARIGTFANYIVYKGGTPHNVKPTVNFGATSTSSCTGFIQFVDSSYNEPKSWLWNFGDGTTSALQNPSHTYAANGTYQVKLNASNTFGNDSLIRTYYININMPAAPITTGASLTGDGSVTLTATGSDSLFWYNVPTAGNIINKGSTFNTPVLSGTTTYYVEDDVVSPVQSLGIASSTLSTSTGGYYNQPTSQGLIFDALAPVTIKSVTVYASTTASRTITLKNASGAVINTLTTSISSGKQTVNLNFDVPAGKGYALCGANVNLWRDKSGGVYPYTISNLISITGNTAAAAGYYYFFYNWQVEADNCTSPRTPVVATIINGTGIIENSVNDFDIYPNPSAGIFLIQLNNQNFQNATLSMLNILGEKLIEKKINNHEVTTQLDATNFPSGIYFVKMQTEKGMFTKKVFLK